ncbi:carbohydrate porin [Synechococcus sp. RedBA-s]|uniref:carbohydrate porin n=1 Tax=Synechococcus sp. RedBA-s TaxID=2823741 RepID=UPI0020CD2CD3|nr:carbohydrate porin [Synechococcus sp. RedBA-s]MCP9801597.1 carbohydrate porin [Synechococcus sp. RedBA-s]
MQASTEPSPEIEPEAGQAAPQPPQPEQLALPEAHLSLQKLLALPDWAHLQVGTIAQPFVNPIGGLTHSAAWMQQTNLLGTLGTGLSKPQKEWQEIDHWTVDLQLSLLNGNPNYGAQIGAVYSPQSLFGPVGFWPTLAALSRHPGKDWWGIQVGILPFEPYFLTPPISGLYVSDLVASTPGIRIPSFPVSPASGPGGVLTLRPTPTTTLLLGSFDLAAVGTVSNSLGVSSGIPPGPGWVHMAQLNFEPGWINPSGGGPIQACRRGSRLLRRSTTCERPVEVQQQLPGGQIQLAGYTGVGSIQGIYGQATVPISLPWGLDHRAWVATTYGGSANLNPNPTYIGGGLVSQGVLPGRPFDLMMIGVARAGFSPTLTPELSYEGAIELGYKFQINPSFSLQPTWLWILRPGGSGKVPGIGSFGLEITWGF